MTVTHARSLWSGTALGDCLSHVCEYDSLRLFVPVFLMRSHIIDWSHCGEYVCIYWQVRLVDWPLVQLCGVPGATNINTSGKKKTPTQLPLWLWTEQMDPHTVYMQYSSSSWLIVFVTVNVSMENVTSIILHSYHWRQLLQDVKGPQSIHRLSMDQMLENND